jgi:putative FmdB family regulatory protein
MPMYEYACRQCDHTFEALVFDGDKVECPECQSERLERLISLPGMAQVKDGFGPCGDPSLPPCGAPGCGRKGR